MQLVKNIAIAVRNFLQTLDYAPISIKEMVKKYFFKKYFQIFSLIFLNSVNNVIIIFQV
jgi:hypothetical protein